MAGPSQANKSPIINKLNYPPDAELEAGPIFHQEINLEEEELRDPPHHSKTRSSRPLSTDRRRPRSLSRTRSSRPKAPNNPCRSYNDIGYCIRGVKCDYYHDWNRPLDTTSLRQLFDMSAAYTYTNMSSLSRDVKEMKDSIIDIQELLLTMSGEIEKLSKDLRSVSVTAKNARLGDTIKQAHSDLKTRMREQIDKIKAPRGRGGNWRSN